ncbi:MAG TPA: hypothetical protein VM680_18145, partial [Verrucomicrobiae bacterium]|nr:hypothetical protein [Verrucomicrobiae bacterium]
LVAARAFGFSLSGPPAPWMTPEIGFDGSIAPMNIGAGYRWNAPIVTYDFDDSFRNFFGARGMAAVEDAIAAVEAGFGADVATAPTDVMRLNLTAQAEGVRDLKSVTMAILLEQAGLANAVKHTYVLHDVGHIVQRNFDPITYIPSDSVNGSQLGVVAGPIGGGIADAVEYPVNQAEAVKRGVAGTALVPGEYAREVSRDDAGGLSYLYATNSFHMELPPPNVQAVEGALVEAAVRPGVGKVRFFRHAPPGVIATNYVRAIRFNDVYVQNGLTKAQTLERTVYGPDILFRAEDLGLDGTGQPHVSGRTLGPWRNHSALVGAEGEGPGTTIPYGVISFSTAGVSPTAPSMWGNFDQGGGYYLLNPLEQAPLPKLELLSHSDSGDSLKLTGIRRKYTIRASNDLVSWTNVTTVSNVATTTIEAPVTGGGPIFYRAVEGAPY